MKEVAFEKFLRTVSTCTSTCMVLDQKVKDGKGGNVLDSTVRREMRKLVVDSLQQFRTIELTSAASHCARLEKLLEGRREVTYAQLQPLLNDLLTRVYEDASRALLFFVPGARGSLYREEPPFGTEVEAAFPKAGFDLREARSCLAFGRPTACVLHLMRAVESVLEKVATELGAQYQRNGWGPLIGVLNKAIENLSKSSAKREFYENLVDRIAALKNAVRNPAIHGRSDYDQDEAQAIYGMTRSFMTIAARQLRP